MSVNDYRTVIGRIADEDDGQSKFQPFSTDERRLLRKFYLKDIERIDIEFPGVLLKF